MPRRPVALYLVATLAAVAVHAQLNPTVKVLPKARTAVPPGCEEGVTAAQPRIAIETAPPRPKYEPPPPRNTETPLRLRALQRAAQGNDYRAFQEALAAARAAHVPESELQKYEDVDRVWSFAQTSPTGAFFDQSSDLMGVVRRYPGYPKAIADATVSAGGRTLYPTRETRLYLAGAGTRTAGVPPAAPAASRRRPAPVPKKTHQRIHKARGGETSPHQPARTPAVQVAAATPPPKPAPEAPTAAPVPAPAPTTTTVAPEPPPTTTTAAPAPQPATPTTTLPPTPAKQERSNANIIVAVILVIVGIGLAVLLFRASD